MGMMCKMKLGWGWMVVAGMASVTGAGADAPKAYHLKIKHSQDPNGMEAWVHGDRFRLERIRGGKKIAEIFDGTALIRQWDGYPTALRLPAGGAPGLMMWKPSVQARAAVPPVTELVGGVSCRVQGLTLPGPRGAAATAKEWVDEARGLVLKRESPGQRGNAVIEISVVEEMSAVDATWWQTREGVKTTEPLAKGKLLPADLKLPRADGGDPVDLGALKGKKALVLNFFATWCQPCVKEIPAFATVYKEMEGQDFDIISIDAGEHGRDPKVLVPPFMKKHNMTWPVVLDEGGWAMDFFLPASSVALPTNIFVSKDGIVKEIASGGLSEGQFRGLVKRLTGGVETPNPYGDEE